MRKEMMEGTIALRANCGKCGVSDVPFQVIKSWGMICVAKCPNCGNEYNVDILRIIHIQQLGGK